MIDHTFTYESVSLGEQTLGRLSKPELIEAFKCEKDEELIIF